MTRPYALIAGVIFAGLLLVTASGGPDFGRYIDWARAFERGDIGAIHSGVESPLGVPVTQWSPGPGLFFAVGHAATLGFADLNHSAYVVGWLATLVFWSAFGRLLYHAAIGDRLLVLLGLATAFIATGAGFYSFHHASESLALALVAVLLLLAIEPLPSVGRQGLAVGIAAATLLLVRSNLGFYAVPAIAVSLQRTIRVGAVRSRAVAILGIALPVMLAMICLASVNRWMTGSLWATAYLFGDEGFWSLDLTSPALVPVLFHPLHGLLAYHPLHLIGFVAALLLLRPPTERLVWAVALALVSLHLWIQASWYAWWMGMATFGMRGLLPVGIVLVAAVVQKLARARRARTARLLLVSTGVACLWSFLLLTQGETRFYSFAELWSAQVGSIARLIEPLSALLLLISLPLGWLAVSTLCQERRGDALERLARPITAVLVGLVLFYCLHRIAVRPLPMVLRATLLLVGFVVVGAVGAYLIGRRFREARGAGEAVGDTAPVGERTHDANRVRSRAAAGLFGATFLDLSLLAAAITLALGLLLFARLAVSTNDLLGTRVPPREFAYRASFQVEEVLASYCEYRTIRGFDERKEALRAFLARNGVAIDCSFMERADTVRIPPLIPD